MKILTEIETISDKDTFNNHYLVKGLDEFYHQLLYNSTIILKVNRLKWPQLHATVSLSESGDFQINGLSYKVDIVYHLQEVDQETLEDLIKYCYSTLLSSHYLSKEEFIRRATIKSNQEYHNVVKGRKGNPLLHPWAHYNPITGLFNELAITTVLQNKISS